MDQNKQKSPQSNSFENMELLANTKIKLNKTYFLSTFHFWLWFVGIFSNSLMFSNIPKKRNLQGSNQVNLQGIIHIYVEKFLTAIKKWPGHHHAGNIFVAFGSKKGHEKDWFGKKTGLRNLLPTRSSQMFIEKHVRCPDSTRAWQLPEHVCILYKFILCFCFISKKKILARNRVSSASMRRNQVVK